jgi:hypothetical protein
MSNEDQQIQSTEFESETNIEEPPSLEETLEVLDKVFEDNNDGIDAEKLLADAEIDVSEFLQRVQSQMEQYPKTIESRLIVVTPLERLDEIDLDFLNDEEVLFYLQAEGIDCGLFLDDVCCQIETNTRIVF